MNNLGDAATCVEFTGSEIPMEQLGFPDNDASESAFLGGSLQTGDSVTVSVVDGMTSSADVVLAPSSMVLGDDQTTLGANLQIGLDLPIPNSTSSMFDPSSEHFTSIPTSAVGVIDDSPGLRSITCISQPQSNSIQEGIVVTESFEDTLIQTTASIANMNQAIHNYAGSLDEPKLSYSNCNHTESSADKTNVQYPVDTTEIKTVDPNNQQNMLLVFDKTNGKNILLPISASTCNTDVKNDSIQRPAQKQGTSSMGTITINVTDFLNILSQAGKTVTIPPRVVTPPEPSGLINSTFPVETSTGLGKQGDAELLPFTHAPQPLSASEFNVLPNKAFITQSNIETFENTVNISTLENGDHSQSVKVEDIQFTKSCALVDTDAEEIQDAVHNIQPVETLITSQADQLTSLSIAENFLEAPVAAIRESQRKACHSGKSSKCISPSTSSTMTVVGGKRIRKPTPKQEQLQAEKHAKEHPDSAAKPRRGRKPKLRKLDSSTNEIYSNVAVSSVARVLDSAGQRAFMEKIDVSVHVEESQCVMEDGEKRWKCLLCTKHYSSKHNLITHILDHSGIKPHCCMICEKNFKQASHLQTHMLTHGNLRPHSCKICNRSFSQASHVKRHMAIHMEKRPHICAVCDRGFAFPSELKAHMEKHQNGNDNACDECDATFESMKKLKAHKATEHSQDDLTCKECGKQYTYPSQLRDHMMKHEGKRPFVCGECGMDFMKEHHLKAHQFTHTGLKPFVCSECGRGFNQKANLQRHVYVHEKEPKFKCEVCDKTFTQPQILKSHMMTHDEKKPYQCKVCGKVFSRLHNLNGHMHMHNGEKPHLCHICGASFTLKGNLNRHKKDKHNLDANAEYTEEEAAQTLNEMSGKRITDDDAQDISDTSPAPKKKRKSFPRKTVTEENGGEMEKEIQAAWQKDKDEGNKTEDTNPQDLLNQILSGAIPGFEEERVSADTTKERLVPTTSNEGVQTASSVENPDGNTEWIAYIPLTGQEGTPEGSTQEVSITLVPPTDHAEKNAEPGSIATRTDSRILSGRGRKRKPVNYGDDFMTSGRNKSSTVDKDDSKKSKRTRGSSNNSDKSNISKCGPVSVSTGALKKTKSPSRAKKASLASVLATKLKPQV